MERQNTDAAGHDALAAGTKRAGLRRREFVGAAAGTVAVAAASTPAAAQSGPDYGGWFEGVDNFDGTVDMTGRETVEITVGAEGNGGAFAFDPAAVRVSPGTEVIWNWTGEGGAHNVVSDGDGPLNSGTAVSDSEATYSHTFQSEGVFKYACTPHEQLGMRGAVVVGASSGIGGGEGSAGTELSGPEWLLSGSVVLAFLSPLVFAAVLRYRSDADR